MNPDNPRVDQFSAILLIMCVQLAAAIPTQDFIDRYVCMYTIAERCSAA